MGFKNEAEEVNRVILAGDPEGFLENVLPGGKRIGREYKCADISGGKGASFSVNLDNGKWSEFNGGDTRGGDCVSLYAAVHGISQGEALDKLKKEFGIGSANGTRVAKKDSVTPVPVPDHPPENLYSGRFVESYPYIGNSGLPVFWTMRYVGGDRKKAILPATHTANGWVRKRPTGGRLPLYGSDRIDPDGDQKIIVVEGEKAANAINSLRTAEYACITWCGGASGTGSSDWSPLYGRDVVVIPDADKAGEMAWQAIRDRIGPHVSKLVKADVSDKPNGWDVADRDWSNFNEFIGWVRSRSSIDRKNKRAVPSPGEGGLTALDLGATVDDRGNIVSDEGSLVAVLSNYSKTSNKFWFDVFHNRPFTSFNSKEPRPMKDSDYLHVLVDVQRSLNMRVTRQKMTSAIDAYATMYERNEPADWMRSLVWDGESRIDGLFPRYFGARDGDYERIISSNLMIGLAARAIDLGCKMDNMIIIEGKQGLYKSQSLGILGGKWYSSLNTKFDGKDFLQEMDGTLLMEVAELSAFSKTTAEQLKANLTKSKDKYRRSYGKLTEDIPRKCIFVGTTNVGEYLRDVTGARRFWPIKANNIDLHALRADRDQLFAEAVRRYDAGEQWWKEPPHATTEQEDRREADAWEKYIKRYVAGKTEVEIPDVLEVACNIERSKMNRANARRAVDALTSLGWVKTRRPDPSGGTRPVYVRVDDGDDEGLF